MIVTSKRGRARGAAMRRLFRHVMMDGEVKDVVELVQGNVADLESAEDARRFGRDYSVRHWILSPPAVMR